MSRKYRPRYEAVETGVSLVPDTIYVRYPEGSVLLRSIAFDALFEPADSPLPEPNRQTPSPYCMMQGCSNPARMCGAVHECRCDEHWPKPLPAADQPEPGETVLVKRVVAECVLEWADWRNQNEPGFRPFAPDSVYGCAFAELRAALAPAAEKVCKHEAWEVKYEGFEQVGHCCGKCGMTRTLGPWLQAEEKR